MFLNGLNGLSGLVETSDSLEIGNKYTFTYEHGRWFEWNSETDVLNGLRSSSLSSDTEILTATRPLFSNRYAISFIPKIRAKMLYFLQVFGDAWKEIGYDSTIFIQAETDLKSTAPGGITQISSQVGAGVSEAASSVLKPVAPYLLLIGIGWLITQIVRVNIER